MARVFSERQVESIRDSNRRINVWEGAVRSGKSFASIIRWLKFIRQGPPGRLILCGRSEKTIKRNILVPIMDLVGPDLVYKRAIGEATLWGRTMDIVGANDDRAELKIRGGTYVGALVDEITVLPQTFVKMLLSRLSVENAQMFATTNPDSPYHWFKKMLDDPKLDLVSFKFNLEDNPSLSESYKENLKNEYSGLWYQRFIEGAWVLAEGTVYDFFDEELHVIDRKPGMASGYIVGVDYGTTNPCVFSIIGYNFSLSPNIWLEAEYYYDSRRENRQKTDSEYAQDFLKFIYPYNIEAIYIDPSAASFKLELSRVGVYNITDAKNDVLNGIRYQAQLLSNGTYKILRDCPRAIEEYGSYCWDSKAAQRGVDQPIKEHDHSLDSQRYALFTHFFQRIGFNDEEDLEEWKNLKRRHGYD